jgi:hypothetical protein
MNQKEVVDTLSLVAKIEPQFTELGNACYFYLTCKLDPCSKIGKAYRCTTIRNSDNVGGNRVHL